MSKEFLTLKDAATKLGTSSSTNMNFIHKDGAIISELILLRSVVIVYMNFQQMMI